MNFAYYAVQMVLELIFMILGSMIAAWFSRNREFRTNQGGARFAGRENMIQALQGLQKTIDIIYPKDAPLIQTFKISSRPGYAGL